ncbi:uncharacterized protein LOC129303986 [Prosopis cineraria]|uniref:uncharacterized protein LOC129303986 n=1 Tax=Prosopis cineraria TaxID=364024 RepID=UPI00241088B4|nr:uncharacterized protein LOC129303986 [Prosopis cineraria]XP_054799570.1 uncharacterized protein LOC129303986 [Prosopis cineraria]XP_054799571.1 uncharacterized protein LOC129303986 [Prosopis cineraria]XP_054799572.1 uncharacterized protein LOC129303986 [Prosopis cineraria]
MDSPQSVVSPFKSSVLGESEKQKSGPLFKDIEVNGKEAHNPEDSIGVLDVYIHQARDIHNICIYHKQDVYAKICLTSNPENTVSTKIINGGGRNPVFDENLRLNVKTVDSSLKCEIWMLSRVKNYLEDQLLGFALVPVSEVLVKNGTLEKEFSLSSTDLFHSPAGFVQLSLAYNGTSPDVMVIPPSVSTEAAATGAAVLDPETTDSLSKDLDKIEFPDPKIENEDHLMVSEYFGISCDETQCSESLATSDADHHSSEAGVQLVESFSTCSVGSAQPSINKVDSPPSIVSTNGVSSPSVQASSDSSDAAHAPSKSPTEEQVSGTKVEKRTVDAKDGGGESDSSSGVPNKDESFPKPVVSVNIEPEPMVVQQDIVDMYMKSMQQFTESLAKMKLPDIEIGSPSSGNSSSEKKLESPASKSNNNSRVFYGSRAFF